MGWMKTWNYYSEKRRQVQAAGKIDIKKIVYLKEKIDDLAKISNKTSDRTLKIYNKADFDAFKKYKIDINLQQQLKATVKFGRKT